MKVTMKNKVSRSKLNKKMASKNVKQAEAVQVINKFSEDEHQENERVEAGRLVAKALSALTDAGGMEWQLGEDCAKASICICLDKYKGEDGAGTLLSIANNPIVDVSGMADEALFSLVPEAFCELLIAIVGKQLNIII
jgi:hypothetical protein